MFCHDDTVKSPKLWTSVCICTKQPLYSIYVTLYFVEVKYFEARSGSFPSMLQIFDNSWIKKWSSEHALSSLTVMSVISVFKTHLKFFFFFVVLNFFWPLTHFWNFLLICG